MTPSDYRIKICDAAGRCQDVDLLDLVLKILLESVEQSTDAA